MFGCFRQTRDPLLIHDVPELEVTDHGDYGKDSCYDECE